MILHYIGKYSGNESDLPQREHPKNSVPFKEPKSIRQLALIGNLGAVFTIIVLAIPYILLGRRYLLSNTAWAGLGSFASCLVLFPHELLHAICFKKDVYLYTNFKQGLLFVVGPEDMSKARFIWMSPCPNVVFGLIPYLIFLIRPDLVGLGAFGLFCLGMGFGDYINVFNALRQVPKGAKTYLSGMHSYWYLAQ